MTKLVHIAQILLVFAAAFASASTPQASESCCNFKSSTIEFYVHDIFSGPNRTLLQVAGNGSLTAPQFGLLGVVDDLITEGKSDTSKALGRMRGSFTSVSLDGVTFLSCYSAVLDSDKYNGTISIFGTSNELASVRTLPVIGGTGDFERASGIAVARNDGYGGSTGTIYYTIQISHL